MLHIFQDLSVQMDHGRNKLQSVVALGEKTTRHTGDKGIEVINTQLTKYQKDYDCLCTDIGSSTQDLETTLKMWKEFDELYSHLENWIKDTDEKINAETELRSTIESKRSAQEKLVVRS